MANTQGGTPICGKSVWPYTENNICVLRINHPETNHKDAKGREFGVTYIGKEADESDLP
jgi:hypothetical protein